jgi:hypothetical protein
MLRCFGHTFDMWLAVLNVSRFFTRLDLLVMEDGIHRKHFIYASHSVNALNLARLMAGPQVCHNTGTTTLSGAVC